jgi:hypothetical protein
LQALLSTFFLTAADLFVAMAPYLLLGLGVAGLLHIAIPRSVVGRLIGRPGFGSVVLASLLGVPLPLCSCSVLPTATYLRDAGASRPAVMSFLVSTPQTGVDSIAATWGLLGPFIAIYRALAALIAGLVAGVGSVLERSFSGAGSRAPVTSGTVHAAAQSVAMAPAAQDPTAEESCSRDECTCGGM